MRETTDPPSVGQLMLNTPPDVQTEDRQLTPGEEEAIIVGAVG